MKMVLEQIKQKLSKGEVDENKQLRLHKTIHAELINEYTKNYKLLSAASPYIFPLGLSEEVMGTATVPKVLRETWMCFYDNRLAEETHLLFFLFDQCKRHGNNAAVAYKIKSSGQREQKFIEAVNADDFLQKL